MRCDSITNEITFYFSCNLCLTFQVARVRIHGFSDREISTARALLLSEIESAYLERDQMQSTNLRDEYIQVILCVCVCVEIHTI